MPDTKAKGYHLTFWFQRKMLLPYMGVVAFGSCDLSNLVIFRLVLSNLALIDPYVCAKNVFRYLSNRQLLAILAERSVVNIDHWYLR